MSIISSIIVSFNPTPNNETRGLSNIFFTYNSFQHLLGVVMMMMIANSYHDDNGGFLHRGEFAGWGK